MTRAGRIPHVVVMTRLPVPGVVKTRLACAIGDAEAAALQAWMGELCVRRLRALEVAGDALVEVRFTGGSIASARSWLGRETRLAKQGPGDLGARLLRALIVSLASGAPAVALVGSDCPAMSPAHVRRALAVLLDGSHSPDVVIGPAADGGYWLLGARASVLPVAARLFEEIDWGTDRVREQTTEAAREAGLRVSLLESLADVDRPEDLGEVRSAQEEEIRTSNPSTLSVVIPALDEEELVAEAVRSSLSAGATEVIVSDGGSSDGTIAEASAAGARVIASRRGRATQMNAGANAASSDALLFLHADCRLPPGAAPLALTALSSKAIAGAFSFDLDAATLRLRWAGFLGRLRHQLGGLPYGDQGLFVARRTFRDLGGFPDLPVMEDLELASRLRRLGRVAVLPARVNTSARGWEEHGVLSSSAVNFAAIAGYRLGVDPQRLARLRSRVAARS